VALVLTSYPIALNFIGGSVSAFMIAALTGMLVFAERDRRLLAAGLLAFAVSFKFYPVLFLAPFAAGRDFRFLAFAAFACVALLFVVPGLVLGGGDTVRFYDALIESFRASDWVAANPHSNYFPHVALRLTGAMGQDAEDLLPLLRGIGWAVAAANMGLIFLLQRARARDAGLWSFQIVCLTLPFVLKTSWPHDFVFLPFVQALLAGRLLEGGRPRSRVAVALFLLLPSVALSSVVFFTLLGDFHRHGFCGFIFWADLLLLAALYVELLPRALRGPRTAS